MTQKANFFKLGLFVILAFGLTAAMLIAFGAGKFFKTETLAETCFDESVQGLDIGSEVKYKGVKIGTVKSITTPTKVYGVSSSYVLVTFALSENCYVGQTGKDVGDRFKKAIGDGLTVFMAFKGLTGAAYLETDYEEKGSPLNITWQPESLYVPSRKSNIKRIGDAINQTLDSLTDLNMGGIGHNLATLVKALNEKANALDMKTFSDQSTALLKELRQTNQKISEFMGSGQLDRIMADAGDSFVDLKTMIRDARAPVDTTLRNIESASKNVALVAEDFETDFGPKLDVLASKMDTTLKSLEHTSKMLEKMVWMNSDTISKAIENFEHTSENLNQLTLELRQYPGRLFLERPPEVNTPERIKEKLKQDD
ncbi:MAG: MlaD family protein [Thermodesulfobacteriota bacterium]